MSHARRSVATDVLLADLKGSWVGKNATSSQPA
jgi:hypothetical protein